MADRSQISSFRLGALITLAFGLVGSATLLPVLAWADGRELYVSSVAIWINAWVVGYAMATLRFSYASLLRDVASLAPLMNGSYAGYENPARWSVNVVTALGFAFGCATAANPAMQLLQGEPRAWLYVWTLITLPALWAAVLRALFIMIVNTRAVYRLGRYGLNIDLHDRTPLGVFARIGVRHLSLVLIGLAVIPLQQILTGRMGLWDFVPAVVVTLPSALGMLLGSIGGVHSGLVEAKAAKLAAIRQSAPEGSDPQRSMLMFLYQREIERVPEWPVSVNGLAQVAVYVIIPPLAWTAAALMENLISALLE